MPSGFIVVLVYARACLTDLILLSSSRLGITLDCNLGAFPLQNLTRV
jgi:hypothetical protein